MTKNKQLTNTFIKLFLLVRDYGKVEPIKTNKNDTEILTIKVKCYGNTAFLTCEGGYQITCGLEDVISYKLGIESSKLDHDRFVEKFRTLLEANSRTWYERISD